MTDTVNPKAETVNGSDEQGSEGNQDKGTTIKLTLNDLMILGFNMVKSGFGLVQSLEKVLDKKFQDLVDRGELKPEDASKIRDDVKDSLQNAMSGFSGKINEGVRGTLNRLNIATLQDLQSLETRLDTLLQKVDSLIDDAAAKGKTKKTATRKPAARKTAPKKTSPTRKRTTPRKPVSEAKE